VGLNKFSLQISQFFFKLFWKLGHSMLSILQPKLSSNGWSHLSVNSAGALYWGLVCSKSTDIFDKSVGNTVY
jgi:hypothetical protein